MNGSFRLLPFGIEPGPESERPRPRSSSARASIALLVAAVFLVFPTPVITGSSALFAQAVDPGPGPQESPTYYVYVASESADEVSRIAFDGRRAVVDTTISVGVLPTEIEGPHGVTVAPDGEHWFVTLAHGKPYGHVYKYTTGTDRFVERTELGLFPASMEISPLTGLLYAVNFNLHGEMTPSTVSVVDPERMSLVREIRTGIMPHGSRITRDGRRQYHVSMMTDELVEVNTLQMRVARRLNVASSASSSNVSAGTSAIQGASTAGTASPGSGATPAAEPTWADPHPTTARVYVANNGSDEVVEVNTSIWSVERRFDTSAGPYNLEVTPDGRYVVVSYKGAGTTGIWSLEEGAEVAELTNSRPVTHGVVVSPDSRFAFVTAEGRGGEPGAVDVIDLRSHTLVDSASVGKQAGGIYFWKMSR